MVRAARACATSGDGPGRIRPRALAARPAGTLAAADGPVTEAGHPEDVYSSWSPSGSPDGTQLAFVSDRSGDPSVWIKGPQPGRLTSLGAAGIRVLTASWSPDGAWLACVTAAAGASR